MHTLVESTDGPTTEKLCCYSWDRDHSFPSPWWLRSTEQLCDCLPFTRHYWPSKFSSIVPCFSILSTVSLSAQCQRLCGQITEACWCWLNEHSWKYMLHKVLWLVKWILYKGKKCRASEDWETYLIWWIKYEKHYNNKEAAILTNPVSIQVDNPVSTCVEIPVNKGLDAVSLYSSKPQEI